MESFSSHYNVENEDCQTTNTKLSSSNSRIAGWVTPSISIPGKRDIYFLDNHIFGERALRRGLMYAYDVLRAVSRRNVVLSRLFEEVQAGNV